MKRELAKARKDGYKIVYLDETMFTRKTCPDTEWCRQNENMAVDLAKLEEPTLAVLCGISKEVGVELFQIFERSVNVDKFLEYLSNLRASNHETKICLFMDNLSAHTSERAKKAMRDRGFRYIYNLPYRCDLNPIEFSEDVLIARAFRPLQNILKLIHNNAKNWKKILLFLGKTGKMELQEAAKSWNIEYKQSVSITSSDSIIIKINKLEKK